MKPWYREPWPWLLMSGPAAVLVAGAATPGSRSPPPMAWWPGLLQAGPEHQQAPRARGSRAAPWPLGRDPPLAASIRVELQGRRGSAVRSPGARHPRRSRCAPAARAGRRRRVRPPSRRCPRAAGARRSRIRAAAGASSRRCREASHGGSLAVFIFGGSARCCSSSCSTRWSQFFVGPLKPAARRATPWVSSCCGASPPARAG